MKEQMVLDVGSLVHRHVQKRMGPGGKLWGNWECLRCKKKVEQQVGPHTCCGDLMEYEEIRIKSAIHDFAGTVDALLYYPELSGFVLCDFKTKEKKKFSKIEVDKSYRSQVFAYKYVLVRPPYSFPIVGQCIVYIARDDVNVFEVFELENDDMADSEFEMYARRRKQMFETLKTGDVHKLPGLCSTPKDDPWCPYGMLCFGPSRDVNLKREWDRSTYNPANQGK
jgi:hypothetical protein